MDENVVFVCFGVEVGQAGQNVLEPLANQDKTHRTDARKHTASNNFQIFYSPFHVV